jgi:hypothetical protein
MSSTGSASSGTAGKMRGGGGCWGITTDGRLGGNASDLLAPLIAALRSHIFAGDRLHGDDTPVPGKCVRHGIVQALLAMESI